MSDFNNGTYRLLYIYVNGSYYPIGCLTSNSFSETSEMLDTTTRQNAGGWTTSIPTNQSYSISFSGLVTSNNDEGNRLIYDDIKALKRNKTLLNWKIDNEKTGYSDFGMGYINSLSVNAEIDSFIDFSAEITGYGEPITQTDDNDALNYTLNVTI